MVTDSFHSGPCSRVFTCANCSDAWAQSNMEANASRPPVQEESDPEPINEDEWHWHGEAAVYGDPGPDCKLCEATCGECGSEWLLSGPPRPGVECECGGSFGYNNVGP
jgi:hypothetical protein